MIGRLALFGATGDLSGRYLLPAVAALAATGRLPAGFELIGSGREELADEEFRELAAARLAEHARDIAPAGRDDVLRRLRYRSADLADPESVAAIVSSGEGALACYLALPPELFEPAIRSLRVAGLPEGSRVVVEKPFGDDVEGARALNDALAELPGGEPAAYRVDHVLGMATTQNLVGLRFANSLLEPLWTGRTIETVELLWEETLALEGRAGYFDEAGALKDVIQNHVVHLLALVGMEPPPSLEADDLHDAKLAALRSVVPLAREETVRRTRRARYAAGTTDGGPIPAYVHEDGVDPARETETFAEISFELASPRWSGTRFVLRGGKAMRRRRKGVVVHFRGPMAPPLGEQGRTSRLWIGIDGPDDIRLETHGATGPPVRTAAIELAGTPPAGDLPAYGRVLEDVLSGGSALSVRGDFAEEAWRVMAPVIEAWAEGEVPMFEYAAGSDVPQR